MLLRLLPSPLLSILGNPNASETGRDRGHAKELERTLTYYVQKVLPQHESSHPTATLAGGKLMQKLQPDCKRSCEVFFFFNGQSALFF